MVLQRNAEVKIWGWADKNEQINIQFIDQSYKTIADSEGSWQINISDLDAGGPYKMKIIAGNEITINDIMVGDVWVCSGQSNMELTMQWVSPLYEDEIALSENPDIRYFEVPDKYDFNTPHKDLAGGNWQKTNPKTVLNFSAVSYFFGKQLYKKYHIPIGLINAALGGSPVESWISEESLKEFPGYYKEAVQFKDSSFVNSIIREDQSRINSWYRESTEKDAGYKDPTARWYNPDYDASGWATMKIPGYWADTGLGLLHGVVWFRKEISVPATMIGKEVKLNLGRIVDADSVFLNGVFVGNTTYQYPPRRYTIPAGVLKEGKNVIVVRVINSQGRGGFVEGKVYEVVSGNQRIDLKGLWQYKAGVKMPVLKSETFIRWKPLGLYNAMIAPLLNLRIKGVIWYQGESNAGRPIEYRKLFPAMINDWRKNWKLGEFPFLFVQLPNFMEAKKQPSESNWALLREAQFKTLSLPNTAIAVTIDLGEWNDIHPLKKEDVGKRLALAAEKVAYGEENIVYSGPVYKSMQVDGNKVRIKFNHIGSGLMAKGESELKGFAIAGADKKFMWADSRIENDEVIVWSEKIANPVAVRYAWADNPDSANLYNKEGLPALPFRTDDF